ncbi:hypothetical protein ACFQPG_10585 [Sphingomonas sp. GCM10030256]|uniref:hypothetical protein n=1 Tax=Sphingomonas sp. GCM10030256 TaxID=3273427 RepID=UPI003610E688
MKAVANLWVGAALTASFAAAVPASAQYHPNYGNYGYAPNAVSQVLRSILNPYGYFGYGYYGTAHPQAAVNRCIAVVQRRLSYQYGAHYDSYGGYGGYGYGYGDRSARILGITRVEQRSATTLRVRGIATSGWNYEPYGYGRYRGHRYGYAPLADLSFKCDVDYRGFIRDIDIHRRRY